MFGMMKVFLLVAVLVCISEAQFNEAGNQCLCNRVSQPRKLEIKDIQIYPATSFCNRVEIVITTKEGLRYCMDPKVNAMKRLLSNIMKRQRASTAKPTVFGSTTGTTITVHSS